MLQKRVFRSVLALICACGTACAAPASTSVGTPAQDPTTASPRAEASPVPATSGVHIQPGEPGLKAGYKDELVAEVQLPTSVTFTGDSANSMLVTSQPGKMFRATPEGPEVVLDLSASTCTEIEQGMLSVTPDPDYAGNQFVYVYYTADLGDTCVNRVSRFIYDGGQIDPGSENVLIDRIPSFGANHNAGDVKFGPDGMLYVSVGDSGCALDGKSGCADRNPNSRDQSTLLGKILRIRPDGSIPDDNPFLGPGSARCNQLGRTEEADRCQETFAWGLRNPFRIAFDPNTDEPRFFINDAGQYTWEEINLGESGADYGWNIREGFCVNGSITDCGSTPEDLTDPVFSYSHGGPCNVVTGGAFVPDGVWPLMDGAYLFSDFGCNTIFQLVEGAGGPKVHPFASGLGDPGLGAVHLQFGPHEQSEALYYTTYSANGQVRRISHDPQG